MTPPNPSNNSSKTAPHPANHSSPSTSPKETTSMHEERSEPGIYVALTSAPLDEAAVMARIRCAEAGANVLFAGRF